jgi:SAM-dependent methyltransferase
MTDIRSEAAQYYDLNPHTPDDIPFYIKRLPSPQVKVLELGCGTGRVTIPLSKHCGSVYGIDLSEAMIARLREKLVGEPEAASKITIQVGDITDFNLGQRVDYIIAPFRVMQNLETDAQVAGLFDCIHRHLAPSGRCILNVFRPYKDRETLLKEWCQEGENLDFEIVRGEEIIRCYDRRPHMDPENLVLYPELVYRVFRGDEIVDEAVLNIAMRCYYPGEFEALIEGQGFQITNKWGGYAGEVYGEGPELVVEFEKAS